MIDFQLQVLDLDPIPLVRVRRLVLGLLPTLTVPLEGYFDPSDDEVAAMIFESWMEEPG